MLGRLGAAMQSAVDDMCAELVNIEAEELAAAAVEGKGIIRCEQTAVCLYTPQIVERVYRCQTVNPVAHLISLPVLAVLEPGEPASVGMMIGRMHDGAIVVNYVTPGGPAELAGVRSGQRLLAVDDVGVVGMRVAQIHELIKGPAGSAVVLSVEYDLWGVSGMRREAARRTVIRAKLFDAAEGWLENGKGRLESDQRQRVSVFEKDHFLAEHVYRRACRQGRAASPDRRSGLSDFPSGAAFDALRLATLEKIETCGELACGNEDGDVGWACCMSLRMEAEDPLPQSERATINGIPQSHTFNDDGPVVVDDAHPGPGIFGGIADLQIDNEGQSQSSHTSRSGNSRQSPNETQNRVVSITDRPEHAGQISNQIINAPETIKAAKDVDALTDGRRATQDANEKAGTAAEISNQRRSMPRVLYVASTPVFDSSPPRGGAHIIRTHGCIFLSDVAVYDLNLAHVT